MSFGRLDHIAIEVADFDNRIAQLVDTGAVRVIRYGTGGAGQRLAVLGDGTGVKIELVEAPGVAEPRFLHFAFRSDDVDAAHATLLEQGWRHKFGPKEIAPAEAYTVMVTDGAGFDLQVISYKETSPDIAAWSKE
jgi:predicted enzyme related to lactoylglutathione lyase